MSQEASSAEVFNQRINILIAVLVAVIAVIGAMITNLESDASTQANKASIAEQQYYYQAIGEQISGRADVNHAVGTAYQLWYQYQVQILSSQKRGESDAVATFAGLRDEIAKTSPIFEPRYFDPATGRLDLALYEADVYRRELYTLEEKQAAADQVASAWGDKSSSYVLQLTLLAVSGFLLGLAVMTKARIPTLVFTASGTLMVVVISIWAYRVSLQPVVERPVDAISAFAEGASLSDQKRWDEALVKFNEAIEKADAHGPYGHAFLLRAKVHSALGNFPQSIADYKTAIATGYANDPTVDASLVQAYFQVGDFASAIQTGTAAIESSPEDLALRQQVNMVFLAQGDTETASKQGMALLELAYEKADVQRQAGDDNAVAEIWSLLNDSARQYDQLVELLENKDARSPIKEKIADPVQVVQKAQELAAQFRAGAIALKYDLPTVSLPGSPGGASPSDTTITIQQIIPALTPDQKYVYSVTLEFAYSGIETGQALSIVTYRNGVEDPSWGFNGAWTNPQGSGTARHTLSPSYSSLYIVPPGHYAVAIYLNGALLAQNEFTIKDPAAPTNTVPEIFVFDSAADVWGLDPTAISPASGDGGYAFYDPLFFFDSENNYAYFLEDSFNYFSNYCTDSTDLACNVSNDADNDGIADEYDGCVLEPGSLELNGCPISSDDADGDGIPNELDACISLPGLADNNGCPLENTSNTDTDGDGLPDTVDYCQYEPGSAESEGCPLSLEDADNDGITNEFDTCPYISGPSDNNGCPAETPAGNTEPDADQDGISDTTDSCIYSSGPAENLGCPLPEPDPLLDSDNDGLLDLNDSCVYSPGPAENYGCPTSEPQPEPDSDSDGIPDVNDSCVYSPGPAENYGCPTSEPEPEPDSDGDGVPDSIDECMLEPGSSGNFGCPDSTTGYKPPQYAWASWLHTNTKLNGRAQQRDLDLAWR